MTQELGDEVLRVWPCDLRGSLFHLRPLFSHLENGRLDPDDLKCCFQLAFLSLEALVYPTWSTNNLIHLLKTEGQTLTIPMLPNSVSELAYLCYFHANDLLALPSNNFALGIWWEVLVPDKRTNRLGESHLKFTARFWTCSAFVAFSWEDSPWQLHVHPWDACLSTVKRKERSQNWSCASYQVLTPATLQ